MIDLNAFRNKDGFIELDKISGLLERKEIRGACEKAWVILPSGEEFLFKKPVLKNTSCDNPCLEVYSALISTEVANMIGIPSAQYDLAIYKGHIGTICKNFLGNNDFLVPGTQILSEASGIKSQKTSFIKKFNNNIKEIKEALCLCGYKEEIINLIIEELIINYYMVDFILTESDRGDKNWLIMNNSKLSPRIDSSLMSGSFYLNSSIETLLQSYSDYNALTLYTNTLKSLLRYKSMNVSILQDMAFLFEEEPIIARKGYDLISRINVQILFERIEDKMGSELPGEYKKWLELLITFRIGSIEKIATEFGLKDNDFSCDNSSEIYGKR